MSFLYLVFCTAQHIWVLRRSLFVSIRKFACLVLFHILSFLMTIFWVRLCSRSRPFSLSLSLLMTLPAFFLSVCCLCFLCFVLHESSTLAHTQTHTHSVHKWQKMYISIRALRWCVNSEGERKCRIQMKSSKL